MKRVAICVTAVTFLLLNWMALGFSETVKSAEDVMWEEGLITTQEYIAAKKHRVYLGQEQSLQTQQPESSYDNQQQQKRLAKEEKAKAAEQARLAKEEKAKAAEQARLAKEETARVEKAKKAEQARLAKEEAARKKQEIKAKNK